MKENDILQAQDVRFRYDTEQPNFAVDGVSMEVHRGEFVAVLGANGCGKSTLAKHFNAILLPESGTVLVEDMDTRTDEKLYDIRQKVGMVFQNPDNQIVANVVEEDVAFAPENLGVSSREIRQRVDDALKAVGMYEYREHAPHQLSGGQKQRLCIARTLLKHPKVLIFDDSTSAVDTATESGIRHALAGLGSVTKLIIAQRITSVQNADLIVILDDGRLHAVGTHDELLAKDTIYQEIYHSQMKGGDADGEAIRR